MRSLLKRAVAKAGRLSLVDLAYLHELQETEHLKRLFRLLDIDIVLDVGANAGQYASRLRSLVGFRGTIVSVEPIPEMIAHLDAARRNDPDWHVEPVAISNQRGPITFNVMSDPQCSSLEEPDMSETSLFAAQTTVARKIIVDGEMLDHLVEKYLGSGRFKRPFMKLDTQGHDVTIVRSCKRLLEFVAFQSELSVKRLYQGTPHFTDAINDYCSRGFDVSGLVPNNSSGFPQLLEIDCIMVRRDFANTKGQSRE